MNKFWIACGFSSALLLNTLPVASVLACEAERLPEAVRSGPIVEQVPEATWYRSGRDWIAAPDACQAAMVVEELAAARAAFEDYFGPVASAGAVIDVRWAGEVAGLRSVGLDWVLPWRFEAGASAGVDEALVASIRAQIESQLQSAGAPSDSARVDALVARALEQLGDRAGASGADASDEASSALEPKAIRHELAHLLFLREVWPSTRGRGEQYGGDAPDWLDETAAVLAESPSMTESRRASFRAMAERGELIALERYLSMVHPVFAGQDFQALMQAARDKAAQGEAAVLSASLDPEQGVEARRFYAQTRGWVDYLLARSEQPRVFADLTRALRDGQGFEAWLQASAARYALPVTLPALERDFLGWAASQ
ncbi:hypothetical protein [Wenzhouxiangella marina]|uniref:Uncharacterized protein n=1 Tax=Wenzhouxiangella marina TaxID=1579979 RepID=A0A0K0XZ82_9GAMM|nr:hypothetical protein [Wenzhouxiangella marina]AKS42994.1 hypothetical protein WM2015_2636 [Wenzhouxiangella marina]MBB6087323.1 hypothetical protein [Wenzhouxiangella marina]